MMFKRKKLFRTKGKINNIISKYNTAKFMLRFLKDRKLLFRLLRGYCRVNYLRKNQLRFVELFVTMACNAKCDFCSNGLYTSNASSLSLEKYLSIIDECARLDVPHICLIGGEPLLYKHLNVLTRRINSHGILSMVATNGYLLTEERVRELAKNGLKFIVCSLLSTDETEHDNIMRLKGCYRHIFEAKKYCEEYGIQFGLATVLKHSDFHNGNFEKIIDLAVLTRTWLSINPLIPTGYAINQCQDTLTAEDMSRLNEVSQSNIYVSTHLTNNYFGFGCPAGNAYLGVTASGDIMPCFFFPVSLGNINNMTLREAWQKILKSQLFKKKYKMCIAGNSHKFINEYLLPIFKNETIPMPIESHPKFDMERMCLKDISEID